MMLNGRDTKMSSSNSTESDYGIILAIIIFVILALIQHDHLERKYSKPPRKPTNYEKLHKFMMRRD